LDRIGKALLVFLELRVFLPSPFWRWPSAWGVAWRAVAAASVLLALPAAILWAGGGEDCPPEHVSVPVVVPGNAGATVGCVPLAALRDVCNPPRVVAASAESADPVDCPVACKLGLVNLIEAIAALRSRVDEHELRFHPGLPSTGRTDTVLFEPALLETP
jgi:hypothetical protein